MRSIVDDRFRRESSQHALRFNCEDCAYFAPETQSCANGFPTEPHRAVDLQQHGEVVFCKLFELC